MPNKQFVVPQASSPGSGGGGGGSGTVTSVGLTVNGGSSSGIAAVTGSPVTTSGTLDIGLSGTSGGVPYFSSSTVLSSSGVLAQHGVVIGGGAGATPTTLSAAPAGTVLAGQGAGSDPAFTASPTLGVANTTLGTLSLTGNTSGTVLITPQATAGSPTLTLPNASGTFAISASSPLVLSATTGALTGPTIVTSAAALTSNALVKGAGLQASAVSTVATDDNTTLTYAGTGGVLSTTSGGLKAGANGGAAGVLTLFGSTSGSETLTVNAAATQITASAGLTATSLTTSSGGLSSTTGNSSGFGLISSNGAASGNFQHIQESITLNTGAATTDSTANLLPANSIILAVTARITTTITTSANWSLGDATTAARFMAANSTLTSGTTAVGMQQMQGSVTTDAAGPVQSAAAKLRITLNANPGAGVIHVDVFYLIFTAPTS